jgi:hypothetical protein
VKVTLDTNVSIGRRIKYYVPVLKSGVAGDAGAEADVADVGHDGDEHKSPFEAQAEVAAIVYEDRLDTYFPVLPDFHFRFDFRLIPLRVNRYLCILLRGLSGIVISIKPSSSAA